MAEDPTQKYLIRDAQGNVYGPADAPLLRDWVGQGRIVAGMFIADRETRQWIEASTHPAVADLLQPKASPQPAPSPAPAQPKPVELQPRPITPQVPLPSQPMPIQTQYAPADVHPYQSNFSAPKPNVFGLISFIASLAGAVGMLFGCLPLCGCIAIPVSTLLEVTAIVLGALGLYQIKLNPPAYHGRGLAMAGLIIGCSVLVLLGVAGVTLIALNFRHP